MPYVMSGKCKLVFQPRCGHLVGEIEAVLGVLKKFLTILIQDTNAPLPKLPVPPLEQTLERYLATVKPLISEQQYERTRSIVRNFGAPNGVGQRLQERLLKRREEKDNWAYDWWMGDMYMNNTIPLAINSNPGMVFPPRTFTGDHDMAIFTARMIQEILNHKEILDRKALPVEKCTAREKGQPLCMAQYYRLLTSYRVGGKPKDYLKSTLGGQTDSEHVIVICRNQVYTMPVKTSARGRLSEAEMSLHFLNIIREASLLPSTPAVGILTSERRDVWADIRESLVQDERNKLNLEMIEKSLLIVCFDEPLPSTFNCRPIGGDREAQGYRAGARDETNMAHQMIHGGGSLANSANRWFDKTVQLVISNDGVNGLCYEHSPSEGVAVVQLMEQVLKQCTQLPTTIPDSRSADLPLPERLQWNLHSDVQRRIQSAANSMDCSIEDLDFYVYRYAGYGKDFIKSCKVSPDVYIQLALQLTYYRLYRHLVATYESASTRRFLLGRVDCIRSVTCEALLWATAMCQDEAQTEDDDPNLSGKRVTFSLYSEKQKLELFDAAAERQTAIMVENILGQGIDIHLLGLREQSKELGESLPEIFADETYRLSNHFALSTSQVPTVSDSFMGYGPVVPDGYGASYNPHSHTIVFCLSAFHSCETTCTNKFAQSLDESLTSMMTLLSARNAART